MKPPYSNFIGNLLDISDSNIRRYAAEIKEDTRFHENLGKNNRLKDRMRHLYLYPGISPSLGTAMYIICRHLVPGRVVETGVSGGTSSSWEYTRGAKVSTAVSSNMYKGHNLFLITCLPSLPGGRTVRAQYPVKY